MKGLACSEDKFNDQLVCPLCDTVLPKDGTQRINLNPDDGDLLKVSQPAFGMQPKQLCAILQNGLDFWAQQQRNEGAIHLEALDKMKDDLKEEKSLNRKLSMVSFAGAFIITNTNKAQNLEGERRKMRAIQEEKSQISQQYEALEKRYEEKSR